MPFLVPPVLLVPLVPLSPDAGHVLYEVRGTTRDVTLADTIETYLRVTHVPEVLATGCFAGAYVARLDPVTFRTTYIAHDPASLERYFAQHTARLRDEFVRRFPSGVTLTREEWIVAERFDP
jgi:hypothetical protein